MCFLPVDQADSDGCKAFEREHENHLTNDGEKYFTANRPCVGRRVLDSGLDCSWPFAAKMFAPGTEHVQLLKGLLGMDVNRSEERDVMVKFFIPFKKEMLFSGLSLISPGIKNPMRGNVYLAKNGANDKTSRKQGICWSSYLHKRFVNALQQLGGSEDPTYVMAPVLSSRSGRQEMKKLYAGDSKNVMRWFEVDGKIVGPEISGSWNHGSANGSNSQTWTG
ncbi:hypothetical protein Tco_1221956 [Tanacetum coccineum]